MINKYTIQKVSNILNLKVSNMQLYRDEEKGLIPQAERVKRGKVSVRMWSEDQLPTIGKHYNSVLKPDNLSCVIASVISNKGGVGKSTTAWNLARFSALRGLKTLCCGLEVGQKTITRLLEIEDTEPTSLDEIKDEKEYSLFDVAEKRKSIKDVIKNTSIPTLNYIPEHTNLTRLDSYLKDQYNAPKKFKALFKDIIDDYDLIIFDNSAYMGSQLLINSLAIATDLIIPLGCDIESYKSSNDCFDLIDDVKQAMDLKWNSISVVPTFKSNTNISAQVESYYRSSVENVTINSIRKYEALAGESSLNKLSVMEYDPKSKLAEDYTNLLSEIWDRIRNGEGA